MVPGSILLVGYARRVTAGRQRQENVSKKAGSHKISWEEAIFGLTLRGRYRRHDWFRCLWEGQREPKRAATVGPPYLKGDDEGGAQLLKENGGKNGDLDTTLETTTT